MNASGDAAEQIVRMTLQGVEVAGKMSMDGAERLVKLILASLKDTKRTKGRASLNTMLKSNKPIKVFELKDKDLKNISLDSVSIQGVGQDSILYNNKKSVREVSLPLHKTQNKTQFIFSSGSLIDTLTIEHINTENFISLECGCFIKVS